MSGAAQSIATHPFHNTQIRVIGPVGIQWDLGLSHYNSEFTTMPLQPRKKQQPSNDHHRKNNPHPEYVYHLRRMHNQPVCNVRTSADDKQINTEATSFLTSMRHHYPLLPVPEQPGTRFGCNKDKMVPARGIVPTSPTCRNIVVRRIERMLPASTEPTTTMTTSHPYQYVPRRRRIVPLLGEDFAVKYDCAVDHKLPVVGKSEGARRPARRKPVPTAPKDTLHVPGFDGGAVSDPNQNVRGKKYKKGIFVRRVALPGWMTA